MREKIRVKYWDTCVHCKKSFTFEEEDIVSEDEETYYNTYIICPNCNKKHQVGDSLIGCKIDYKLYPLEKITNIKASEILSTILWSITLILYIILVYSK